MSPTAISSRSRWPTRTWPAFGATCSGASSSGPSATPPKAPKPSARLSPSGGAVALSDLRRFEFAEQAGRRLEEERLVAVEALMDTELLVGDHAMVLGELSGLVESFPLRERLWGQLILALYRSGRQAEALRAYARVKETLATELGVEPSPELAALEERILLHDPALTEVADLATADWLDSPELITFSSGETVVEEGSPADAVYWIEAGEVEIFRTDADGTEVPLARLGTGRYFGELASLLGTGRTASVRAAAPTTLSVHTVESFRRRLGTELVRPESGPEFRRRGPPTDPTGPVPEGL